MTFWSQDKYFYHKMEGHDSQTIEYTNENLQKLLVDIAKFEADCGATDILRPLKDIFRAESKGHSTRRVFLLTDGQDYNK